MQELLSRSEKHFKFSSKEAYKLIVTSLVAAFGLTLSQGYGFFDLTKEQSIPGYFLNFAIIFLLVMLALFFHISIQKLAALKLGYEAKYTYWKNGFVISTLLCFASFGFLPLFFTGSLWLEENKKLRVGRHRYGFMQKDAGVVAFIGPLSSIMLALLLGFIYAFTGGKLLFALIAINLFVAVYSLIPLPTFEGIRDFKGGTTGLYLFIASRWVYVFTLGFVISFSLLVMIAEVFSLIIALILGIFASIVYYNVYEQL
jgi:Zn-dependent protease